jgi:hypothetical protein
VDLEGFICKQQILGRQENPGQCLLLWYLKLSLKCESHSYWGANLLTGIHYNEVTQGQNIQESAHTQQAGLAVTLQTFIRVVSRSNLGWGYGLSCWKFLVSFLSRSSKMTGHYLQIGHDYIFHHTKSSSHFNRRYVGLLSASCPMGTGSSFLGGKAAGG